MNTEEEKTTTLQPPRPKARKISKYHRVHAHSNPLADKFFYYPANPYEMNWKQFYPNFVTGQSQVENLDIGCGYFLTSLCFLVMVDSLFPFLKSFLMN